MGTHGKINPQKRHKLNNPERFEWIPPKDIIELLHLKPGMNIADIGAGTGYFANCLTQNTEDITIHCLDTSSIMIDDIISNFGENPYLRPQIIDSNHYPLADNSIDAAYSIALFHELDDYSHFAEEHKRILKPGAPLLVIDWEKILESSTRGPSLEYRIATETVVSALENEGFRDITIHRNFVYHFGVLCYNM